MDLFQGFRRLAQPCKFGKRNNGVFGIASAFTNNSLEKAPRGAGGPPPTIPKGMLGSFGRNKLKSRIVWLPMTYRYRCRLASAPFSNAHGFQVKVKGLSPFF
jgi:hypothetical protein